MTAAEYLKENSDWFDKSPGGEKLYFESEVIRMMENYAETYGSKGSDDCQFEPSTNTSSATICKHCGQEKFLHKQKLKT